MDRTTEIPWLRLYGRSVCTAPHSFLYEPELAVILQGSKEVIIGEEKIVYNEDRFLLTAINLPVVSYVTRATAERPFMAVIVKLDLARIRHLILQYDIPASKVAPTTRGIGTAPLTLDLLQLLSRLFELLATLAVQPRIPSPVRTAPDEGRQTAAGVRTNERGLLSRVLFLQGR